jgi:hypothetical protein
MIRKLGGTREGHRSGGRKWMLGSMLGDGGPGLSERRAVGDGSKGPTEGSG